MRNRLIISRPGGEWSPCQSRGRWPETRARSPAFPVARGQGRKSEHTHIFPVATGKWPEGPKAHLPGGQDGQRPGRAFPGRESHLPGGQRPDSQGRTPFFPVASGRPRLISGGGGESTANREKSLQNAQKGP